MAEVLELEATAVADMVVVVVVEQAGATETPVVVGVLGGKHITTALRMFGPFFSS